MRVLRESRDDVAVVHGPAVLVGEVGSDSPAGQRHGRSLMLVAGGVVIDVMHCEDEGIDPRPWETKLDEFANRVWHG